MEIFEIRMKAVYSEWIESASVFSQMHFNQIYYNEIHLILDYISN